MKVSIISHPQRPVPRRQASAAVRPGRPHRCRGLQRPQSVAQRGVPGDGRLPFAASSAWLAMARNVPCDAPCPLRWALAHLPTLPRYPIPQAPESIGTSSADPAFAVTLSYLPFRCYDLEASVRWRSVTSRRQGTTWDVQARGGPVGMMVDEAMGERDGMCMREGGSGGDLGARVRWFRGHVTLRLWDKVLRGAQSAVTAASVSSNSHNQSVPYAGGAMA